MQDDRADEWPGRSSVRFHGVFPGGAVDSRLEPPEPSGGIWPFLARDRELLAVLDAVGQAEPGSVVISGASGVGRTRLAQEAVRAAQRAGRHTEWVTCTREIAAIPLCALAHLLPAVGATDPATAWQALASALHPGQRGTAVVGIDDAHLLDDLSAALVHRLVLTRTASVVLTVRSGAPAPDSVAALWKDGLARRLELAPLTRAQVERLLTAVLAGTVDSRTCEYLLQMSSGAALFLHELVAAGHETERFRKARGVWRWQGRLMLTQRLTEVVQAQLGELDPAARAAAELLAIANQLDLEDLVGLTSPDVVAGLERRGIVVTEQVSGGTEARLAQPLHKEVLCAQTPQAEAGELRHRLTETACVRRWTRENPVRIAELLLLPGDRVEPAAFAHAALQANAMSDHELAERLARAALGSEAGGIAAVALAEALRWQGRHGEAERVAVDALPLASSEDHRARLATTCALNQFFGLGRVEDALVSLGREGHAAAAVRAVLQYFAGRPEEAIQLASSTSSTAESGPWLRLWGSLASTIGLCALGRGDEALAAVTRGWAAFEECTADPELAITRTVLRHVELAGLLLTGRIREAEAVAAEQHRATLSQAPSACDAMGGLALGLAASASGSPSLAARWLTEAAARLADSDPIGCAPLCLAKLVETNVVLRDDGAAEQVLSEIVESDRPVLGGWVPQIHLARAWRAGRREGLDEGAEAALRAGSSAATAGQRLVEAEALHTAARLGRASDVAARLGELAAQVDGQLIVLFADHARAIIDGSGDALDGVAEKFESLGARLLAADAAAEAARLHQRARHPRKASTSTARATRLARAAGGAWTPSLDQLNPPSLTRREHEIAVLAAAGTSNLDIARKLVLSVRTVETHLAHVYDKLGINNRAALRKALENEAEPG
ncbi:LuxR C-terminal-related transcriptional regulator [Pseudonocardia halophobica]|uniref:helix-turn-helix transcriptional regulator n=1 Tax=Pseudonocardia halophobica TaxID=29401 RepID=UPI003D94944C